MKKENVKKQIEQLGSKEIFTEKDIEKILGGKCAKKPQKKSSNERQMICSDNLG